MNNQVIAMWSGPRSLSTALMRSFENREDCYVSDEPFYGDFLRRTNIKHPGRETILSTIETDREKIISGLQNIDKDKNQIWYQKHMTHHMFMEDDFKWINNMNNCFLIRNPKRIIISYAKIYKEVSLELVGSKQQKHIFDIVLQHQNKSPIVVDADDLQNSPKSILSQLCSHLNIPFSSKMLSWAKGKRDSDGIWGEYWYQNVYQTTSFISKPKNNVELPKELLSIYHKARIYYNELLKYKINP